MGQRRVEGRGRGGEGVVDPISPAAFARSARCRPPASGLEAAVAGVGTGKAGVGEAGGAEVEAGAGEEAAEMLANGTEEAVGAEVAEEEDVDVIDVVVVEVMLRAEEVGVEVATVEMAPRCRVPEAMECVGRRRKRRGGAAHKVPAGGPDRRRMAGAEGPSRWGGGSSRRQRQPAVDRTTGHAFSYSC